MLSAAKPLRLIHESDNSRIYHKTDGPYGKPVVIKVSRADPPTPSQLIRFRNEYEFTKNLTIDGVRNAIAQTSMEDKPALVMEYVAGQTLKQAFVERKQSVVDFLRVAIQIARTLAEIHQEHIIHRDINSDNILVDMETKKIKLIDFGLASRLGSLAKYFGNPERLPGTLAYISPEQTGRMNRVVDSRTDLYSSGVTFYEMLTGRLPFESDDPLALVHAHMAKAPRPVTSVNPEVPPLVSEIVMKLLAKNAEDRYQSAFGLKADLERCLAYLQDPGSASNPAGLDFPLGREDHSGQFHIPGKLYGRSAEIATLLSAFDRVAAGGQEFLLVTGHAGVGKSALVAEIHKPVTRERGYFIGGKFDQYQQNQPYAAFAQAFDELADLLLSESGMTLQRWRDKIISAVKGNGAVLTEVIPGLEDIIGKQPAVPKLGGPENRNRFHLTFQTFVQAISTAEHPLVVFIDDWQWADLASLELLKALLMGDKIAHFLLIGAYRDSEVDQLHPFVMALNEITEAGIAARTIVLENLQRGDVRQLIQESLAASTADSEVLTDLVYKKTRGNAFFTRQFLHTLYEEGWLSFDFNTSRWTWNIAQIEAQNITNNVVELMAGKLKKLSPETARLLQLAACMGNEFDLRTLVLIGQTSGPAALKLLSEPLSEGLLISMDSYYKLPEMAFQARFAFLHDRVQQAAYAQVSPRERQIVHLKIARLLLASTPKTNLNQRIFSIVQHYNHSGHLITDPAERLTVAELNMTAAGLAYGAAAFRSAQGYLKTALSLMPHDAWTSRYDVMLRLHSLSSTVLSLTGDFEQMERIVQITETQARTMADTAQVKQSKIQSLLYRGDYSEAIELGLAFVEAMGVPINRNPSSEEAYEYLQETSEWLTEARIEGLVHLPEASTEAGLILEVASVINGPIFNTNMNLFFVFVSQITKLCVEQGLTPWAPVTLITFTSLLSGGLHDINKARLLAAVTMQLLEERYHSDSPISPLSLIIGGFIRHRHDHLKSTIPVFTEGVQKGLATGNYQFVGYCAWWHAWHFLFTGAPLAKVEAVSRQAEEICRKVQMRRIQDWCLLVQQVSLNLEGKSAVPWILTGEAYDEQAKLALAFQLNDLADVFRIFLYKAWLHYLFGHWKPAVEFFREAESYLPNATGHYFIPLLYLYDTLAHAALADDHAAGEVPGILRRINYNLAQLEVWVRFAPMNHQHKKDLMEAEKARIEGRNWDAVTLYEKAIRGARDNEFLNEEALAYELCGRFWTRQGNLDIAQTYLIKAHDAYRRWGAMAKAEQLQIAFELGLGKSQPQAMDVLHPIGPARPADQASSESWLDINSLLKACRTLSQTVQLPDLLAKMIEIVLENAGAERALVLCRDEGEWFIVARGQAQDLAIQTSLRLPVSEAASLSLSVFNYVVHSGKALMLENASRDPQYGSEAYLSEHEVKSVLCVPICHKGELDLILYLENNLTECAFKEDRLEFLQLLSGQMAISLENAVIYDSLKTSIAERKQAQETLKESEERLRLALEGTYDGIWDWNVQSGQTYFSPRYYTMMGYEPNEFPATYENWRQRVHPDDLESAESAVQHTFELRRRFAIEFRFKAKNGEWRWILSRGKVVESDVDGKAVRVAGSHTDITERKQAEEELRESRQQLSDTIDFLPDATFVIDREGKVIAWNRAIEEMTGISAADMLGKGNYEYALPFYRERRPILIDLVFDPHLEFDQQYVVMERTGTVISGEAYFPLLGGDGAYLFAKASALFDSRGNVVEAIESVRDLTDRRRMEKAVAEAEAKYRSIFENAPMGIFQSTLEGRFLSLNMALARILGYDSPEEVLSSVLDIRRQLYVSPERRFELLRLIEEQEMVQDYEVQFFRKDMSLAWMTLNIRAVRDMNGKIAHMEGIVQDITDSKILASRLNQAQKMEAIGTLAGGIAHDFNNILAPIIGYSELSLHTAPKDSRLRHNMEQVLLSANRAKDLVKQILTFSRKSEPERRPVQVSLIVKETLKLLRSSLPSTIEIRRSLDDEAVNSTVMADPIQIHQVLMNLCTNAHHAMRESGGVLSINLENVDIVAGARRVFPDLDPGSYLKLTVADTGHGIDESVRSRIFDPYFTTKGPSEGTGLGLALVYGIVKNLAGGIAVSSKAGEGTTFDVYFPRTKPIAPSVEESENLPSGKGLVLVVDDEKSIVDMYKDMLKSLGYEVADRYSSLDALEAFRAHPESFDLVITDLTMPQMTGIDLAKEILRIRADTPIILCTGFSEETDENRIKFLGIKGFLMKPVALRDLAFTVSKVLSEAKPTN